MSALVSQGDIIAFFKQDAFDTCGSDCASLVAPLLGNDSAFDTTTSPLAAEATSGERIVSAVPCTSAGGLGRISAASMAKCSRTGLAGSSSAVPKIANDNEAVLSTPRQRAHHMLSRATIHGVRAVPHVQGHSQSEPLCESVQQNQSTSGSEAGSIRVQQKSHEVSSAVQISGVGNTVLDWGTGAAVHKAPSKEFLSTPYDFSMSRAFKFSDGSKINVSLERSL